MATTTNRVVATLLMMLAAIAGAGCNAGVPATTGDAAADKVGGSGGRTVGGTGGAFAGSGGRPSGSGGGGGVAPSTGGAPGTGGQMGSDGGTGGMALGTGGAAGRGTGGGGPPGTGGTVAGSGGVGVGSGGATPPANCGTAPLNQNPFGCPFAWGENNPGGALTAFTYLQFMSNWVGSEVRADGSFPACNGCTWLSNQVAKTNLIPVFYAYFIGFLGHANGLPDGNLGGPPNLTTGGATLIRNNRAKVVQMHAWYAQQAYAVWKTKPLVWLLDGDYVQYTASTQTNPLTYAELGQLTADITCAIKAAMPNAIVAINHSAWNSNDVTNAFWGAMKTANVYYDLVWTTGMGNTNGFFNTDITASSYNAMTGTFSYVHTLTGRKIFVDTSFGASAQGDSWSNTTAANINARIADGVIAANVTGSVPSNYASAIGALAPSLTSTCP